MLVSRRTFIQSSLVASLAAAVEASHAPWLLRSSGPIQIAVAGLGSSAAQHLALYSAIPGVHVTRIADDSPQRVASALEYLADLDQKKPNVSTSIDTLLADRSISAISLPQEIPSAGITLHRILAAGIPVLVDAPPPLAAQKTSCRMFRPLLHHRVADLLYPGAPLDLHAWSSRGTPPVQAKLILERRLTASQTRAVLIAAVYVLLRHRSLTHSELARWSHDAETVEFTRSSRTARIHLPEGLSGPKTLDISLLPVAAGASMLSICNSNGSMEVPIWRSHDAQSSVRTIVQFLNSVRTSSVALARPDSAVAASSIIDRFLVTKGTRS